MELENSRWWHWVLLSIPIGWALAYFNSTPVIQLNRTAEAPLRFEDDILHAPVGPAHTPWVKNLTVHPVIADGALHKPVQVVTYEALSHEPGAAANAYIYKSYWFCAAVPYEPTVNSHRGAVALPLADPQYVKEINTRKASKDIHPGYFKLYQLQPDDTLESIVATVYGKDTGEGEDAIAKTYEAFRTSHSVAKLIDGKHLRSGQQIEIPWRPQDNKTVEDWLTAEATNYSWVSKRFAWWETPQNCDLIWGGGAFLIIGVIWPITLRFLTGAGLAGAKVEQKHYDMSRFGTGAETKAPKSQKEMSEADKAALTSLTAKLEASVKDGLGPEHAAKAAVQPAAPGQTRDFNAQPLEAPAISAKPEDGKEFTGEFYPVAHPADKPKPPEKPK